jgi:hypothetical membrane protein
MTKRSVVMVIVLTIITFFIYSWIWFVKTKNEMNRLGSPHIPTAWIWLLPFGMWYWQWKWAGGVEHVTRGKQSQAVAFILVFLLGFIGMAIVQAEFNKTADLGAAGLPQARVA